jgi:hypothetical protein
MTDPTTAVPDFAAWSKTIRDFANDIADGDGVSEEQTRELHKIGNWCEERSKGPMPYSWAEEPDGVESPKRMARRVAIGKAIDDERAAREAKTP